MKNAHCYMPRSATGSYLFGDVAQTLRKVAEKNKLFSPFWVNWASVGVLGLIPHKHGVKCESQIPAHRHWFHNTMLGNGFLCEGLPLKKKLGVSVKGHFFSNKYWEGMEKMYEEFKFTSPYWLTEYQAFTVGTTVKKGEPGFQYYDDKYGKSITFYNASSCKHPEVCSPFTMVEFCPTVFPYYFDCIQSKQCAILRNFCIANKCVDTCFIDLDLARDLKLQPRGGARAAIIPHKNDVAYAVPFSMFKTNKTLNALRTPMRMLSGEIPKGLVAAKFAHYMMKNGFTTPVFGSSVALRRNGFKLKEGATGMIHSSVEVDQSQLHVRYFNAEETETPELVVGIAQGAAQQAESSNKEKMPYLINYRKLEGL